MTAQPQEVEERASGPFYVGKAVHHVSQKMIPEVNVEAYLTVFELVAKQERLPATGWVAVIAFCMLGNSQKLIMSLRQQDILDYVKLIAEILAHPGIKHFGLYRTGVTAWTSLPSYL